MLDGLGLAITPTGISDVDAFGITNVSGIWAAGDLIHPMGNVARSIAGGSNSAIAIVQDLVASQYEPDAIQHMASIGPTGDSK